MIYTVEYIQQLLDMLDPLRGIEQTNEWHPEKDVYTHSIQCCLYAMRETDDTDAIIAALLHDVGKQVMKLGHEKESVAMIEDCCSVKTTWLVSNHMRINHYLDGSMTKAKKASDLQEHPWFDLLVALNRWDKLGRKANWNPQITAEELTKKLNDKAAMHFKPKEKCGNPDMESHICSPWTCGVKNGKA